MLSLLKKAPKPVAANAQSQRAPEPDARALIGDIDRAASTLGRDAAEVRGAIDDAIRAAEQQAKQVQVLARQVADVAHGQQEIVRETGESTLAVERARNAVDAVGTEVLGIVDTLRDVSSAASQITKIALQTRLVAFNASIEAKRAGDAGRGFSVVADAVRDLASRVDESSRQITQTVSQLDERIGALTREIQRREGAQAEGGVHHALDELVQGVARIEAAAHNGQQVCSGLDRQMGEIEREMNGMHGTLSASMQRTEAFLRLSERLIEITAACGIETSDSRFIRAAQGAANRLGAVLEEALQQGLTTQDALFDDRYVSIPHSNPPQHTSRFSELADRLFPKVQDPVLQFDPQVVTCIASDRNGYIPCHNPKYNNRQRAGDPAWNAANARNRRIFDDRSGLASARNTKPFLLQTYRRDMGNGNFVLLKEVAAPVTVFGRHWGAMRMAYKFS